MCYVRNGTVKVSSKLRTLKNLAFLLQSQDIVGRCFRRKNTTSLTSQRTVYAG